MDIVDSHVHFWQPHQLRYHWLRDFPDLNQPMLPDHVPQKGDGWQAMGAVFVQADCLPEQGFDEAVWVTKLAQADKRIQAIVAFAPLETPEAAQPLLEQYQSLALVKGIRRLIQSEELGFSVQPEFVRGVQMLARYGYSFDICIRHWHLPDAIELVRQCPNVAFVLDHAGKPDIKAGALDPWRANIKQLARFDNVTCKVSGMVTEADTDHWQPADLQPYIDYVLETFGTERLMWGSDAPVLRLAHTTYERWVTVALNALNQLSLAEKTNIFTRNTRTFYRLA